MADYFQEMRRRELGEPPNTLRMARYLVDIGLFEDNFSDDWSMTRPYVESWQWQDGQNDPKEPQPACQKAIKNLQTCVIEAEGKDCSICLTEFKKTDVVKKMPCHHMFHELCILTWLNQNNTCPFCRHRLPAKKTGAN